MRPCADRRRPSARPNRTGRRRRPPVRHRSDSVCSDQHPWFSRWCGRGFWRRGSFYGWFLPGTWCGWGMCDRAVALGGCRRGVDPLLRLRLTASSKRQIEIGGFVGRVTGRSAMRRSSGVRRPGFVGMVSGVAGHVRGPAGRDFSCTAGAGAPTDALGRRSRSVPTAGRRHQRHCRAVGADGRTDEAFSAAFPALRDWLPVVIMPRGPPRRRRVGALRNETACCGLGGPNGV